MNQIKDIQRTERSSNLELYRIIVMLFIVAHHSIVSSGMWSVLAESDLFAANTIFSYCFGMWGKTGINCFVLITGYFLCESQISVQKFLKLLFEILFYNLVIGAVFGLSGYEPITWIGVIEWLFPFGNVDSGFISGFLIFYLFIPFLRKFTQALSCKEHLLANAFLLMVYTLMPLLGIYSISINYFLWFSVLFVIASFIRRHADIIPQSNNVSFWGWTTFVLIVLAMLSVIPSAWIERHNHFLTSTFRINPYWLVQDSNAFFAVLIAISSFLWFKNLKVKQSKFVNSIASSCFGVLLIHANCNSMRQWLWFDTVDVVGNFSETFYPFYIVSVVLAIFAICVLLDKVRIYVFEKPLLAWLERKCLDYRF